MSSGDPKSDHRQATRAPITLRVDYKRLNMFFADYTKNISKGGTFIKTSNPLPLGTEFVFLLTLPQVERTLELTGTVMWIGREGGSFESAQGDGGDGGDAGDVGMGIRFHFANDEEREQVASFVEGLMSDTLGEHLSKKLLGKT